MDNRDNKYIIKEVPANTYRKYSIMIMEELYSSMGVDVYHNHFAEVNGKEYTFYAKKNDALVISPRNFLETYSKVVDENSGKVARDYVDEKEINNMRTIRSALSTELTSYKAKELLRQIYIMYGINAITSNSCDSLDDWELLFDKNSKNGLQFIAKCNNSIIGNSDYELLSGSSKLDNFIKMAKSSISFVSPIVIELCSISPEEITKRVETKRKIVIPKPYKTWITKIIYNNQRIMLKEIFKNKTHSYSM